MQISSRAVAKSSWTPSLRTSVIGIRLHSQLAVRTFTYYFELKGFQNFRPSSASQSRFSFRTFFLLTLNYSSNTKGSNETLNRDDIGQLWIKCTCCHLIILYGFVTESSTQTLTLLFQGWQFPEQLTLKNVVWVSIDDTTSLTTNPYHQHHWVTTAEEYV